MLFIPGLLLALACSPPRVLAHAGYDHSQPAANERLPAGQSPTQVKVWFSEQVEPRFSELSVFDKNGVRVDRGDSHINGGDPKALLVALKPDLPDGPYTVIVKNASAEDGHIIRGSFAFLIGEGELPGGAGAGSSPLDIAKQATDSAGGNDNNNANPWSIGLRWFNYLGGAALMGAMIYSLLVWRPAIEKARATRRMGPQLLTAYQQGVQRSGLVVWLGLGSLALGWVGWLLYQTASFSGQNLGQILTGVGVEGEGVRNYRVLSDFLLGSRYGQVWLARSGLLVLLILAWLLASRARDKNEKSGTQEIITITTPSKTSRDLRQRRSREWQWVTAVLAAGVLLTTSLNSHAAGVTGWFWLAIGLDWLHLLSTAIWTGGLLAMSLGLAAALPALLPGTGDRTRLLAAVISAFSRLAILSVLMLLVTGTLQTALHLDDVGELITTPYGLSLSVKLSLLIPLLLLGAYNLLVVSPRMGRFARSKAAGPKEGAGSIEAGKLGLHFRQTVLVESGLIVLVLLAAAFLTSYGPPRGTAAATGGSRVLYFQGEQGWLKLEVAISPGQVGENRYEARLIDRISGTPVWDANLVDLRLQMVEMDMGEPRINLKPEKGNPGRYLGQGSFTSMAGTWHGYLLVQREGREDVRFGVTFKLNSSGTNLPTGTPTGAAGEQSPAPDNTTPITPVNSSTFTASTPSSPVRNLTLSPSAAAPSTTTATQPPSRFNPALTTTAAAANAGATATISQPTSAQVLPSTGSTTPTTSIAAPTSASFARVEPTAAAMTFPPPPLTAAVPPEVVGGPFQHFTRTEGDLQFDLVVSPGKITVNTYSLKLTKNSGQTVSDASSVNLAVTSTEMDMGVARLELKPLGQGQPGWYQGRDDRLEMLSMYGKYRIEVLVQMPGQRDVITYFEISVITGR